MKLLEENEWVCERCGDVTHGELEGSDCTDGALHHECHQESLREPDGCPWYGRVYEEKVDQ